MSTTANREEARRAFRLDVPEHFNYTVDVVEATAAATPDKLALLAVDREGRAQRLTFADVADRARRTAAVLRSHGIGKGDRVFVMLPRVPAWYDVLLACCRIGAVPMPGTTQLTGRDVAYRVGQAEACAAVTDGDGRAAVEAAGDSPTLAVGWEDLGALARAAEPDAEPASTRSDDPLLLYFTSGTEAYPKMVLHTQASYGIGHEITARFWHDLGPDDLHWTVSDTGWAKAAWGKLYGQWRVGAAVFLFDARGKVDPGRLLELIGEHGVTSFCAPPTLYRAFVQLDLGAYDWSRLRHCTSAGEPLNPEVIRAWREATGLHIYDGYGQTETVNLVANYPDLPIKPGSMGKPAPGFDVRVVDDDGAELAAGEEGHLAVRVEPERPVGLFKEYWRDEERTAQAFRNGWYYTGDRAAVDEDGYLWFVGRSDDVIISAAYRIGPFEVESALVEHPAVAEAAVVGKPDPERGQIVKAFVTLAAGHEPGEELTRAIQEHVRSVTAPYKYPREVEYVTELPKTISGKIRRVELRQRA